jgi:Tfp pilus assembly protein PilN
MPEELTDIDGVGESKAEALREAGFETVEDLRKASQERIAETEGVGKTLAARIKADVGGLEVEEEVEEAKDYEKRAQKLRQKRDVLDEVQRKSVGPVHVLDELLTILSRPENVEQRYNQRKKDWNVEWNPRHVWINTLKESEGSFEMSGRAVDADDVAEFLHRLETATHFQEVKLDFVRPTEGSGKSGEVVEFRITGQIQYQKPGSDGDNEGS